MSRKRSLVAFFVSPIPKKGKYSNVKCKDAFGELYDSKKERTRGEELRYLENIGQIVNLERQVPYSIYINQQLICRYVADFVYIQGGKKVVEDVKGVKTPIYRLKKKLLKATLGIEIKET